MSICVYLCLSVFFCRLSSAARPAPGAWLLRECSLVFGSGEDTDLRRCPQITQMGPDAVSSLIYAICVHLCLSVFFCRLSSAAWPAPAAWLMRQCNSVFVRCRRRRCPQMPTHHSDATRRRLPSDLRYLRRSVSVCGVVGVSPPRDLSHLQRPGRSEPEEQPQRRGGRRGTLRGHEGLILLFGLLCTLCDAPRSPRLCGSSLPLGKPRRPQHSTPAHRKAWAAVS